MYTVGGIIGGLGWPEILVILGLGVLLFGRRLPEVGRSLGKGIVEFKRGLKGIGDEIEEESSRAPERPVTSYRPPLAPSGQDVRVSRADVVEPATTVSARPEGAVIERPQAPTA